MKAVFKDSHGDLLEIKALRRLSLIYFTIFVRGNKVAAPVAFKPDMIIKIGKTLINIGKLMGGKE